MIIVVGKDNCPWCDRVKEFLKQKGLKFRYFEVAGY